MDTPGGEEEFVLDVDDEIYNKYDQTRISREDVANLCVASLGSDQNASFDCITIPRVNAAAPQSTTDEAPGVETGEYSPSLQAANSALQQFLERSLTSNYAL